MRTKVLAALAGLAVAVGVALVPATAASASTTRVYFEKTPANGVVFVPACTPTPVNPTCDPRGPGSWFTSTSPLSYTRGGPQIGTVSVFCLTTRKTGADYYGNCTEVLYTPQGIVKAVGEINESGLERFEPQSLPVVDGGVGTLTVLQVTYPDEFKLTLNLA